MKFKNPFSSVTLYGVLLAFVSRFFNASISPDEGKEIVRAAPELIEFATSMWPILLGIIADFSTAFQRIKATNFNLKFWQSNVFWSGFVGLIMTGFQLVGVDWTGLEDLPEKVAAFIGTLTALVGSVMVFIGRFRATKPISVP